jgi:PAS domain S-box-containing protein
MAEILFSEDQLLVSKTDLRGKITYCNPSFIQISSFSKEELLGSNHNIVRHEDMPKKAFFDLWNLLKEDTEWSGCVKNKTKKGDYYWVYAHISLIFENGEKTGYLSVRRKPLREEIEKYDKYYKELKREEGN